MTIKSSQTLVSEALKVIKTITAEEALKLTNEGKCTLIDIREKGELDKAGRVESSNHIPRGMLEFWLDPDGPYFKSGKVDMSKEIVLFCAGGLRSALAVKSLKEMGFEKVSHIDGGFAAITQSDFKIV
jgi:rhodanese-related sulfurtransferase